MSTRTSVNTTKEINLTYRPASFADLPQAVALFNACSKATIGRSNHDKEEIELEWRTPGFDLGRSTRVACTVGGVVVGCVEVWDISQVPVTPWIWGCVHPEYEGHGIGRNLMNWAEGRAMKAIDRAPHDARVAYRTGTLSTHTPSKRLFQAMGMTLVRRFLEMRIDLQIDIAKPAFPDNIALATFAEYSDVRKLHHAIEDAFRDHWGYVERPEEEGIKRWQHWIENDKKFDPTLWFVALDGEQIAGICLCQYETTEDPEMGHVATLGVRRPWRRKGVALAMLHHAFKSLRKRGRRRVSLGVDAESLTGANRLYKKAGMDVHREYATYEKVLREGTDLTRESMGQAN